MSTTRPPLVTSPPASARRLAWAGVSAMMLGSFTLVTSEFLPPSILTSLSADLGVSEGTAGLAVTATAFAALLVAPAIGILFPRLDRRLLLTALAGGAAISNLLVAVAPHLAVVLVARLLLGAAVGGFWSMALVVATRLVSPDRAGRAMMVVNTGGTLATVAGVPLGVALGSLWGWRTVFVLAAVVTAVSVIGLRTVLPSLPPAAGAGHASLLAALRTAGMKRGLAGLGGVVAGHFAAFTYIRAALDQLPAMTAGTATALLTVFGIGGAVGNFVLGTLTDRHLRVLVQLIPILIGVGVAGIATLPGAGGLIYLAVGIWGAAFGGIPNAIYTWAARIAPGHVESAAGLVTAMFQAAIVLGSGAGGLLVDRSGPTALFLIAAVVTVTGGTLMATTLRRAG